MSWFVLGFTADALVGATADARMAFACNQAWERAGRPDDFAILSAAVRGAR